MNRPRRPFGRAFTLLEVMVSLAILAVALTVIMRSFTLSLRAARLQERITVATLLARGLVEEFEIIPPQLGTSSGEFGSAYEGYSYEALYEDRTIDYPDLPALDAVGKMVPMRRVAVDIYWRPAKNEERKPKRILHVESAITGSERYTFEARKSNEFLQF